jgi:hypothetical protein
MEIEQLRKELIEISKRIDDLAGKKETLPKKGWLKSINGSLLNRTGDETAFGFTHERRWVTQSSGWTSISEPHNWERRWATQSSGWTFISEPHNWCPAHESEIKSALIAEAERRGFKVGGAINRSDEMLKNTGITNNKVKVMQQAHCDMFEYRKDEDKFYYQGFLIYHNGQWAEIIKEELLIAGERVEYKNNTAIIAKGCYTREDLMSCIHVLQLSKVTGIEVEKCNGVKVIVSRDEIQNILNNWK